MNPPQIQLITLRDNVDSELDSNFSISNFESTKSLDGFDINLIYLTDHVIYELGWKQKTW